GLEAAVELVVLTGAADVVQHREQLGQHLAEGLLADRDPVALDALAVVVVLGLQPLEVGETLRELGLQRGDLVAGARGAVARGGGGLRRGRRRRRLRPDLAGLGVDAPPVADHRALLLLALAGRGRHDASPFGLSSSTISASTTSSSCWSPPWAPAVGPASPAPACAPSGFCAYIAAPIFWLTCARFSPLDLMASPSGPSRAVFSSETASLTSVFSSSETLSSFSRRNFSVEYARVSAWLRTSASSLRLRSSSAYCSASRIMRSMSSLGSALPPVMTIDCSLPVPWSFALTFTMPLASMSKVTSICGTPRGAGGRP